MVEGLGITTLKFFVFLAMACAIYWLLPKKKRWPWLLAVNLVFIYESTGLAPMIFLAVDVVAIYVGTMILGKAEGNRVRALTVATVILIVVSQLVLLKYYNNMASWIDRGLFGVFGIHLATWRNTWLAPIGLSYFSLSAIGYVLDVFWRTYKPERNLLKVILFITWFPALVSGPFVRFREQRERLFGLKAFSYRNLKFGMERILWGLFKKMVIADRLAILTSAVFANPSDYTGWIMLIAVVLFALQIYCDFSGCMDIVLGASEMFQVTLPENFKRPFFSQNLSEFWRRWHISLGLWAKDYVMYPLLRTRLFAKMGKRAKRLFGKKHGKVIPTYIAMLILWIIIGIWHGGSFKYIVAAGLMPWIMIVGGQLLQPVFDKLKTCVNTECFSYRLFTSVRTTLLMCAIWVVAMAGSSTKEGIKALAGMLDLTNPWVFFDGSLMGLGLDMYDFFIVFLGFLAVLVVGLLQEKGIMVREALERQNLAFQWLLLLGGMGIVLVFGIYGPAYNAAGFIYAGF